MPARFRAILTAAILLVPVIASAPRPAAAQDSPRVEGTLNLGKGSYKLTYAVAYETKTSDFELITVLVSSVRIPLDRIQAELRKDPTGDGISLSSPYLKLVFSRAGKLERLAGWADNSSFSTFAGGDRGVDGELAIESGRVRGKSAMEPQGEGALARSFTLQFYLPLGISAAPQSKPAVAIGKPTVSGKFVGSGQAAKIGHVVARSREPFADQPALTLVFSEKDPSAAQRPDNDAAFGRLGSALVISVGQDGGIFGCEVAHAAHAKKPFSSLGKIRMADFDWGDGYVRGQITTDGPQDAFGQIWDVELTFAVPLPASPGRGTASAKAATARNEAARTRSEPARQAAPAANVEVAAITVRELAFPKDITGIEYKQLVEQLTFKSGAKVQPLAADLTRLLTAQGWTKTGMDLVTAHSAILNRERGEATLTIMLKPDENGSAATVFTTGLNWSEN